VSPFSNQCECITGLYYDTATAVCRAQRTYTQSCTTDYECVNNLLCLASICTCLTTQDYITANQTCLAFATYDDTCNTNGRTCEARYGKNKRDQF